MPVYEYECRKCKKVNTFTEKMFPRLTIWQLLGFGKKKCKNCGSKDLKKIVSAFSSKVERTYTENLNELKSMGNVNFVPPPPKPPWGDGPPPGGCPYEKAAKEEQAKLEKEKAEKKAREPIVVR